MLVEQLILLAGMVVAAASGRAGIDEVDEDRYTLR